MKKIREKALDIWMHRIMLGFRCQIDARVCELGMNATDAIPLLILSEEGSSYLVKLSKFIGHTHTSVLRHIDALEDAGYVVRKAHPSDRRMKVVELTPKGEAVIPKLKQIFKEVNELALTGFSTLETKQLHESLERMQANLMKSVEDKDSILFCDGKRT